MKCIKVATDHERAQVDLKTLIHSIFRDALLTSHTLSLSLSVVPPRPLTLKTSGNKLEFHIEGNVSWINPPNRQHIIVNAYLCS